jgi:hypothetical protein
LSLKFIHLRSTVIHDSDLHNGQAPAGQNVVSAHVIFEGKVSMQNAQNGVYKNPVRSKQGTYLSFTDNVINFGTGTEGYILVIIIIIALISLHNKYFNITWIDILFVRIIHSGRKFMG